MEGMNYSHTKLWMKAIQHEIEIHGIVYFQTVFEFLKYIDRKNLRISISYLVITGRGGGIKGKQACRILKD